MSILLQADSVSSPARLCHDYQQISGPDIAESWYQLKKRSLQSWAALHRFLEDYQRWQHGSYCSWQYLGYSNHQECSVAASVTGLDDSAEVIRCGLLPQTHIEDEDVSSYEDEERVRQHDYKGTWRRTMLLHGRWPAISLLRCSSTYSIASSWLRYLFMALLLPCLLCCFSDSSGFLCLLCHYPLSPLLLRLLCAPLPALRFSAYFAHLHLLCCSAKRANCMLCCSVERNRPHFIS